MTTTIPRLLKETSPGTDYLPSLDMQSFSPLLYSRSLRWVINNLVILLFRLAGRARDHRVAASSSGDANSE